MKLIRQTTVDQYFKTEFLPKIGTTITAEAYHHLKESMTTDFSQYEGAIWEYHDNNPFGPTKGLCVVDKDGRIPFKHAFYK